MNITDIAVKNLLRRKSKAVFVLAGLAIGVATVVAVITYADAMTADITHKLEKYGANILIAPRTDHLTLSYGGITLGGVSVEMREIRQSALARIATIENAANVAAVGPIVLGSVMVGDRRVMLAGVDFKVTHILKPWWQLDGVYPVGRQLVVGAEAARVLDVGKGDVITISGGEMTVSGLLEPTGSQDDQLLFTGVATAQSVLGKVGTVSMAEVAALCNACPIDEMVRQITNALPMAKVMAIQKVVEGRMATLAQFRTLSFGISSVIVLIGGLVVLVTMMGSVRERRREIGIFRAIGFRKGHVMRIIFTEAGLLSLTSGIVGYGVGNVIAVIGMRVLAGGHAAWPTPDPVLALGAVFTAVAVGLLASAYPAIMASRLDPNDALKTL
jgi:putative ABC transport system permease protein